MKKWYFQPIPKYLKLVHVLEIPICILINPCSSLRHSYAPLTHLYAFLLTRAPLSGTPICPLGIHMHPYIPMHTLEAPVCTFEAPACAHFYPVCTPIRPIWAFLTLCLSYNDPCALFQVPYNSCRPVHVHLGPICFFHRSINAQFLLDCALPNIYVPLLTHAYLYCLDIVEDSIQPSNVAIIVDKITPILPYQHGVDQYWMDIIFIECDKWTNA